MDNSISLQKIISSYCPWTYDKIDLALPIQDRYVSKSLKNDFSNDICDEWPQCDCTELHNKMFSVLVTGNDILAFLR